MILLSPGLYTNESTIAEGVTIAASGVTLTNLDGGRIYTALLFTAGGSSFVNNAGAALRLTALDTSYPLLITGSLGADSVTNAGSIAGGVELGAGNDVYIDRDGSVGSVDLGADDDIFRDEGAVPHFVAADGGSGTDRIVLANSGYQMWGSYLQNFEILEVALGGNFSYFNGYQDIILSGVGIFVNLIDSANPLVDLQVNGHSVAVRNSSLNSITGSAGSDYVELGINAVIANGVSLGGGADTLSFWDQGTTPSTTAVAVDGGSGTDTIAINMFTAGARVFDLSLLQNFEKLEINAGLISDPTTATVQHIDNLTDIQLGHYVTLNLTDTQSPAARIGGAWGGTINIGEGSVVGRYGFPDGPWDNSVDKPQADPSLSVQINNDGLVTGDIRFYIGDDLYDGRDGSIGGTVYGNGGNDILLGGSGVDRLVGGYGIDTLTGGAGIDILTGGPGSDRFDDSIAGLAGDTITDLGAGDRIILRDASLAGFSFSLNGTTLSFTGGSITLSGFTGQFSVGAASGGGVELLVLPVPDYALRHDFNGDGIDDILWRHSSGVVTNWLGNSDGSFNNNQANMTLAIPTDWRVVDTGDVNGDGRSDVLWRHSSGELAEWLGQPNGGFINNHGVISAVIDNSWQILAMDDFSGDGRADLVWRHTSGEISLWKGQPNGGFVNAPVLAAQSVATAWSVAATGDFNGDGRSDVLWRHSGGELALWQGQWGGGFVNAGIPGPRIDTSWTIAGSGDFNGDGRSDVLWRHSSNAFATWLGQADGTLVNAGTGAITLDPSWGLAQIGDLDGDGRDDLFFHRTDGNLAHAWSLENGSFGFDPMNFVIPTDWKVQDPGLF